MSAHHDHDHDHDHDHEQDEGETCGAEGVPDGGAAIVGPPGGPVSVASPDSQVATLLMRPTPGWNGCGPC